MDIEKGDELAQDYVISPDEEVCIKISVKIPLSTAEEKKFDRFIRYLKNILRTKGKRLSKGSFPVVIMKYMTQEYRSVAVLNRTAKKELLAFGLVGGVVAVAVYKLIHSDSGVEEED